MYHDDTSIKQFINVLFKKCIMNVDILIYKSNIAINFFRHSLRLNFLNCT